MISAIHKRPAIILPEILEINQPSSVSLYSVKEWARVHARSVQSVKEEGLGQIPKGYPLKFFVDGGKILQNNQLGTNALELPGQMPREAFTSFDVCFGGRGGGGILLGAGCDGYDAVAPQSLFVFLFGVLELWMCRGLHYRCCQWNMLKCTLSFTVVGAWPREHIHAGKKRHDQRTLHVHWDRHFRKGCTSFEREYQNI